MTISEAVASLCSFVLLCSLLPVAIIVRTRHKPMHGFGIFLLAVPLTVILIAPAVEELPAATWPTATMLAVFTAVLLILHKRFWQAARAELHDIPAEHDLRRTTDLRDTLLTEQRHAAQNGG